MSSSTGLLNLAPHGQKLVTAAMYIKGKHFLGASELVSQHGGNQYVVLHLLCQGIEIILKALLLSKDFDQYWRLIASRRHYGHNLIKVANEACMQCSLESPKGKLKTELALLNLLYSEHLMRYGSYSDIVIDPRSISFKAARSRILAVVKIVDRNKVFSIE